MIIIAAMSSDRVIGSGDTMPWNVPEEYAQFLQQVAGQTLIMGRRSFEVFGSDLDRSRLIVVSRSLAPRPGIVVARSLDDAIELARQQPGKIFIGGGATIYEQTLPFVDRLHLSVIEGKYDGDAYFPDFDERDWRLEVTRRHAQFRYLEYARIA